MKKCKLGDVLDVKRGTSLSGQYYAELGDKIRLTLGNFDYPNEGFKYNTSKKDIYFTGEVKEEYILKKDDIITPLTEQVAGLLGETARIPESNKYIQSGDIGLVLPKEGKIDNSYAYYLLSSPMVKKQLGAGAQQTKIRHTSPDKIKACEVWIPDINYQKKAGKILDLINNKIMNNNVENDNLYELAMLIYQYYFLQFDFKNKDGKAYKSNNGTMVWNEKLKRHIPEGWKVQNLSKNDLTQIVNPGIIRFEGKKTYLATADVDKNNVISGNKIEYENRESRANMQPKENTIWFAKMKNSVKHIYIGEYAEKFIKENILSTGFLGIECTDSKYFEYLSCFINSDYFEKHKDKLAHGATQEAVNNSDIKLIPLLIPDNRVLDMFHKETNNIFHKIYINNKENDELRKLRNFLLPLFINGQIKIKK